MKKFILLTLTVFLLMPATLKAQESTADEGNHGIEASVGTDIVSHYMWRGTQLGRISIQPDVKLEWQGLYLKANGNIGLDKDDAEELDVTLGFSKWGLKIGVTDFWATGNDPENRYFYYDSQKGNHQFEGFIGYSCKYGSLTAHTMFYGNDFKISGDRAYSTFIELNVPFYFAGLDWDATVGVTPFESAGHLNRVYFDTILGQSYVDKKEYFYADGFTCTMASLRATKRLTLGDVKTPVFVELHTNPYLQKANLLVGVSIQPF